MEMIWERLPFSTVSAVAFFVVVILSVYPSQRMALWRILSMPTPSTKQHLSCLDSIRGLAALWIAVFHIWQWPQPSFNSTASIIPFVQYGNRAVPIFVVLSGFLIYRSLRRISSFHELRDYAIRRTLRIFPLYVATILVVLATMQIEHPVPTWQWFIGEVSMLRTVGWPIFSNPPAWSLYVEVLFYLILPVFVATFSKRIIVASAICLTVLSVADVVGPRELSLWKYFFFGILASEAYDMLRPHGRWWYGLVMFLSGCGLLFADVVGYNWLNAIISYGCEAVSIECTLLAQPPLHIYTVQLGIATALLVVGALLSTTINRFLSIKPLQFLGVISYSIFLWHGFVIVADLPVAFDGRGFLRYLGGPFETMPFWVPLFVILPSVLFWSLVSFALIERPFLKLRPKHNQGA